MCEGTRYLKRRDCKSLFIDSVFLFSGIRREYVLENILSRSDYSSDQACYRSTKPLVIFIDVAFIRTRFLDNFPNYIDGAISLKLLKRWNSHFCCD